MPLRPASRRLSAAESFAGTSVGLSPVQTRAMLSEYSLAPFFSSSSAAFCLPSIFIMTSRLARLRSSIAPLRHRLPPIRPPRWPPRANASEARPAADKIAKLTTKNRDAFFMSGGLRALSPLIRRLARPLSERERDAHCGFAYFVGEHAILDRARQHHTANA